MWHIFKWQNVCKTSILDDYSFHLLWKDSAGEEIKVLFFLWRRGVCDNQPTLCNPFYMHLYESCLKPTMLKMNLLMGSRVCRNTWGFRGNKMLRQWQGLWYIHTGSGFLCKVHLTRSQEWAEPTWLIGSRISFFPHLGSAVIVQVKYKFLKLSVRSDSSLRNSSCEVTFAFDLSRQIITHCPSIGLVIKRKPCTDRQQERQVSKQYVREQPVPGTSRWSLGCPTC
jgi:hypothetical protein